MTPVQRLTVNLSAYPDLVVIYLGMRVRTLAGIKTLFGFGPKIQGSVAEKPDGLLLHENLLFSLFPPHTGMRQYWRDFDSLERWARSDPHRHWWQDFVKNSGGTGFWHETYFIRGGIEAIYDDVHKKIGLSAFAPQKAKGLAILFRASDSRQLRRDFLLCETAMQQRRDELFNRVA